MSYRIVHTTEYEYGHPASGGHNEARLLPRSFWRQTCVDSELTIEPTPNDYRERIDYFGNRTVYFAVQQPHQRLVVTATSVVEVAETQSLLERMSNPMPWEQARERARTRRDAEHVDALQFTLESPLIPISDELATYAKPSFNPGRPTIEAIKDLMARIHKDFVYDPSFTTVSTPLADVLAHRRGVCQDFAHLAIGCLRSHGLPARYVSGYIETTPPPGKERLIGADASHAWFSVFVPGSGWIDFDPTNNQVPLDQHVIVAWGRDYCDVAPLKGVVFGAGCHALSVSVDVEKLLE